MTIDMFKATLQGSSQGDSIISLLGGGINQNRVALGQWGSTLVKYDNVKNHEGEKLALLLRTVAAFAEFKDENQFNSLYEGTQEIVNHLEPMAVKSPKARADYAAALEMNDGLLRSQPQFATSAKTVAIAKTASVSTPKPVEHKKVEKEIVIVSNKTFKKLEKEVKKEVKAEKRKAKELNKEAKKTAKKAKKAANKAALAQAVATKLNEKAAKAASKR